MKVATFMLFMASQLLAQKENHRWMIRQSFQVSPYILFAHNIIFYIRMLLH